MSSCEQTWRWWSTTFCERNRLMEVRSNLVLCHSTVGETSTSGRSCDQSNDRHQDDQSAKFPVGNCDTILIRTIRGISFANCDTNSSWSDTSRLDVPRYHGRTPCHLHLQVDRSQQFLIMLSLNYDTRSCSLRFGNRLKRRRIHACFDRERT